MFVSSILILGVFISANPSMTWKNSIINNTPLFNYGYNYKVVENFVSRVDNIVSDLKGGYYLTLEQSYPDGQLIHLSESGERTVLLANLNRPDGLREKNNKLYLVEEVKNGRFIEFNIKTAEARTIAVLNSPEGLTQMSNNSFLITEDIMDGRLLEVTLQGEIKPLLLHLSRPESVVIDSAGVVYFTQTAIGTVSKYAYGKVTTLLDGLNQPDQLAIDNEGYLWIGEDAKLSRLLRYKENVLETIAEKLSYIQGVLPIGDQLFIAEQGRNRILNIFPD